jgi:hypothetical protein
MLPGPVLSCFVTIALLAATVAAQDRHAAMDHRGALVMGFDQALTRHHFLLFTDGGAIDVSVRDASDATNRAAIRSHLPHIATMFADGNFEAPMLVHDSKQVPGTRTMSARKDTIRFHYVETPAGGRVDIVTTDRESLAAVHDFLRFQIADHRTGDPTTVQRR